MSWKWVSADKSWIYGLYGFIAKQIILGVSAAVRAAEMFWDVYHCNADKAGRA